MAKYRKRIIDNKLSEKLEGKGAVLIQGPKWCGKTTSAEQIAESVLYMSQSKDNILMAELSPEKILEGKTPRLIDEWQLAPSLWDNIRFEVDHRKEMGQFILTGSSVPIDSSEIKHSGTGRFSWLTMRPMSLYESDESNGQISLKELFDNPSSIFANNPLDINKLAFVTCRGGWPESIDLRDKIALMQAFDYYDGVVNSDISRVDSSIKDPERFKRFMRSYARNQGTQIPNTELIRDMMANDNDSLSDNTIYKYLSALNKIFVIEEMLAWNPNLRSKTAIRTSNTRYFIDPSIAVAALGLGPNDLLNDLCTFGFLFETLCVRDLRIFADSLDGSIYHYRDKDDLECDAVIHLRNGSYGLIEIKLGNEKAIEYGATNLKQLKNKIDTTKMKSPSFLMVLVGVGKYAYKREDGVFIVPIGCLKN